jgi:hypothetical protein
MILNRHRRVLQAIAQVRRHIRALFLARICGYARPVIGPKHRALSTQQSRHRSSWRSSHDPHLPAPDPLQGSLLAYPHPWLTPDSPLAYTIGPAHGPALAHPWLTLGSPLASQRRAPAPHRQSMWTQRAPPCCASGPKENAHWGQPTSPWPARSTLRACTLLAQRLEVAVAGVSLRQCPSGPPFQHLRFRPMVLVIWQPATRCITRLGGRP